MPFDVGVLQHFAQRKSVAAKRRAKSSSHPDQHRHKAAQVSILRAETPIELTRLIVLAIGIVVAVLRPPNLIPHQQERCADGDEIESECIPDLSRP